MTFNPFAPWFPGWGDTDRREPLSGDVSQWFKIFSPSITVTGMGEPELEAQIVRDVATYGAQLAPIIDLVLALAEKQGLSSDALTELTQIRNDIRIKKDEFRKDVKDRARHALAELEKSDPDALGPLLDEFRPDLRPE